jgi:hypothetical protein
MYAVHRHNLRVYVYVVYIGYAYVLYAMACLMPQRMSKVIFVERCDDVAAMHHMMSDGEACRGNGRTSKTD